MYNMNIDIYGIEIQLYSINNKYSYLKNILYNSKKYESNKK